MVNAMHNVCHVGVHAVGMPHKEHVEEEAARRHDLAHTIITKEMHLH